MPFDRIATLDLSGVRVEERTGAVWTFEGDRVVRLQMFHDPEDGRRAANGPG